MVRRITTMSKTSSKRHYRTLGLTLLCLAFSAGPAWRVLAQSGGSIDLRQNVIAGGGNTSTGSGNMRVDGTVGQPAAGKQMTGGTFTQVGGFWPAILGVTSALPVVQFSSASYTVSETGPRVNIALTRSGNTASSASVSFATNDAAGLQNCN